MGALFFIGLVAIVVAIVVQMSSGSQIQGVPITDIASAESLILENIPGPDVLAWRTAGGLLAIDLHAPRMLVADQSQYVVLSPEDIVEITLHELTLVSGRSTGTIARALVGGAIAGGTGAVVAALGANSESSTRGLLVRVSIGTTALTHPSWDIYGVRRPDSRDPALISPMSDGLPNLLEGLVPYLKAFADKREKQIETPVESSAGFCFHCGSLRYAGARYCPSCGCEYGTR